MKKPQSVGCFDRVYILGRALGKGAFADVLECALRQDKSSTWAVKVVRKGYERTFDTEVSALRAIGAAEGIIELREAFSDKDLRMVFQLARGGSLLTRLKSGHYIYPEDRARSLLRSVLKGLVHIHSQGYMHRDIKPENILLLREDDDTVACLADFGLATPYVPSPALAAGTECYMAPEVVAAKAGCPYTEKCDLWSLGAVASYVLTGLVPGKKKAKPDKTIRTHLEAWSRVSPEAKVFVASLLEGEPCRRPTAVEALEHPWITGKVSLQSPPEPMTQPASLDSLDEVEEKFFSCDEVGNSDMLPPSLPRLTLTDCGSQRESPMGKENSQSHHDNVIVMIT